MNNEEPDNDVGNSEETEPDSKNGARSSLGLWLVCLLVLVAIALSGYNYYQIGKVKTDQGRQGENLVPIKSQVDNLAKALAESNKKSGELETQLAMLRQEQVSLAEDYGTLFRQQNMGNNDWALAEVEYLLVVATHRLQLEANVALALAAMQAADDRIRNSNDPGLLTVRRQLTADINSLKAVEAVDISGLVLYLSDLAGRVQDLPLQQVRVTDDSIPESQSERPKSSWNKLLSSVWQELRSLVHISRQGEETLATILPEQQYFLYQNLRLQLESARYAVLRRDTENLHVSVSIIVTWLNDYFDVSDNGVTNIIDSIDRMKSLELNPVLPDISSSLESIRAHIRAGQNSAATETEAPPELEQ